MHSSRAWRLSSLLLTGLVIAATAEATPYLPSDIAVGARLTGFFSFPTTGSPPDRDPDGVRGFYEVAGSSARTVIRVGDVEFSTSLVPMVVQTLDQPGDADWIQLFGSGNERTFAPFLSNFARQNSLLEPRGGIGLNFRFPPTYFSSDAFPTSIDPLATVPHPRGLPPSGIFGGVEGISMQRPNSGIREWGFAFIVDPLELSIAATAGVLTGRFAGTIYDVDDRAVFGTPSPVPEPASFVLFMAGLAGLRCLAKRHRRT